MCIRDRARADYAAALSRLRVKEADGSPAADILDAYREILDDDVFFEPVVRRTLSDGLNIDFSLLREARETAGLFAQMDDPYLAARAGDITNVCDALILRIQGAVPSDLSAPAVPGEKWVVFARDLTPDAALRMDRSALAGFVTEQGGLTSHTVILARSLGIPAVVGAPDALEAAVDGETVLLYGDTGRVILDPDEAALAAFRRDRDGAEQLQACLLYTSFTPSWAGRPSPPPASPPTSPYPMGTAPRSSAPRWACFCPGGRWTGAAASRFAWSFCWPFPRRAPGSFPPCAISSPTRARWTRRSGAAPGRRWPAASAA